jgi:hypothetical protein
MLERSGFESFLIGLYDSWSAICSVVGVIGIAVMQVVFSVNDFWKELQTIQGAGFAFFILLLCVGNIKAVVEQIRMTSLEEANRKLRSDGVKLEDQLDKRSDDYFELVRRELGRHATNSLQFTNEERISLYRHDGESFTLLGRYAEQPEYAKRSARSYPADEGCLGRAWRHPKGEVIVERLPDPHTDMESYVAIHKDKYNMGERTIRSFTMPSRSLWAFVLKDRITEQRLAVLVFESIKPVMPSKETKRNFLNGEEVRNLMDLLEVFKPIEPSRSLAQEEGF